MKVLDKYEFRIKTDQIKKLIQQKDYPAAMKIADTIDWSRTKNMSLLTIIGEVYEKNGRYEDSLDILLMVYERYPAGRTVVYKLCELFIQLGNYKEAVEFYQEYAKIAPYDTSRLILKYKICKGQGKDLDTLIKILEDLKSQDYHEEWAYELALLYHQARRIEQCVAECDEIDLWFGEGYYVTKALELKMRYQPLTPVQMKKYENRYAYQEEGEGLKEVNLEAQEPEIKVRTVTFDTLGLQAELAKSIDMLMSATDKKSVENTMENVKRLVEESQIPEIAPEPIVYEEILSEDEDGQISLYVPEQDVLEKQITGQMTIEDVLKEWEKTKESAERAIEESRMRQLEKVRNRALEETGNIMERLKDVLPTAEADRRVVKEAMKDMEPSAAVNEAEEAETLERTKEWIPPKHYRDEDMPVSEAVLASIPDESDEPAVRVDVGEETAEIDIEAELKRREIGIEQPEAAEAAMEAAVSEEPEAADSAGNEEQPDKWEKKESKKPAEEKEKKKKAKKGSETEKSKADGGFSDEQREILSYFMDIPGVSGTLEEIGKHYSSSSFIMISGPEGSGRTSLATRLVKASQLYPDSVGKKIAKTTGSALNEKNVAQIFEKLAQGSLIVERAEELSQDTLNNLYQEMKKYKNRLQVYFIGKTKPLTAALKRNENLYQACGHKITLPIYRNDDLVAFARAYARGQKYSIGDMGVLALYTRIGAMQTLSHKVTLGEVKEIVDEAIVNSGKFTPKKFLGKLFATHIDEDGLIVLNEQDFQEKETGKNRK